MQVDKGAYEYIDEELKEDPELKEIYEYESEVEEEN